ncbi:unnamed protein product [Amaranthus hypochondriacus]
MALAAYLLLIIVTIIPQNYNLVHAATEGFDDIVNQLGIGNSSSTPISLSYRNNIVSLISTFIDESPLGFLNTSTGSASDRAYGYYLCRGDLSSKKCRNCLKGIRKFLVDQQMIVVYSSNVFVYNMHIQCVVHYANSSSLLVYMGNSFITGSNFGDDLVHYKQYNTTLLNAFQEMERQGRVGNWTKDNYASKVVEAVDQKIYILVQCRPDISAINCSKCISDLHSNFKPFKIGGTILGPNCFVKYNNESFFGNGYRSYMPSYFHVILLLLSLYLTIV